MMQQRKMLCHYELPRTHLGEDLHNIVVVHAMVANSHTQNSSISASIEKKSWENCIFWGKFCKSKAHNILKN